MNRQYRDEAEAKAARKVLARLRNRELRRKPNAERVDEPFDLGYAIERGDREVERARIENKHRVRLDAGRGKFPMSKADLAARKEFRAFLRKQELARNPGRFTAMWQRQAARRKTARWEAKRKSLAPEEWEAWQDRHGMRLGSAGWLLRESARFLAPEQGVSEDEMTLRIVEGGGVEFLERIAEAEHVNRDTLGKIRAVARALGYFIDPDGSEMFKTMTWARPSRRGKRK